MSDARERLRQYLEQRRELGESEFVLDALSVEDALKVLGSAAGLPAVTPSRATGQSAGAGSSVPRQPDASAPPSDSPMRRAAEDAAKTGDWREALRAVDAGGAARTAPFAIPPAKVDNAVDSPPGAPPSGTPITIGAGAVPSTLGHLETVAAVAQAIAACKACDLYATAINPVPGEGDPNAKFVVVGEAPGATEDELGRPFVGKSGELLNKILEAIGFKREQVFVVNVLKHRPPGNRNPAPSEIAACRPFLLRQLEILKPRVVLALGTFAAQTLLETDVPIGKLRGIEHTYHGIPLIATYHPAALLRNPTWKRPAWEDVQLARRIFDRA